MRSPDQSRLATLMEQLLDPMCMEVEQLRGTFVRRTPQGEVAYRSPLPLPFHYGFCPDRLSDDGSGLDLLLVDRVACAVGDRIDVQVIAVADFQDGPDWDPKLVVRRAGSLAPLRWGERALVCACLGGLARVKSSRWLAGSKASQTRFFGLHPLRNG